MNLQKIENLYKTVPYQQKPEQLTVEEWQIALRRQFADRHHFVVDNIGNHAVFSDFRVTNPDNNSNYKIAIRSGNYDLNFCECMDFKTNGLGTCKHIEAVLLKLNETESYKHILECHFQPNYSSVHLKYGNKREVKLRIGYEKEAEMTELANAFFDQNLSLKAESFAHFEVFVEKAKQIQPSFRCYNDAMEYIISVRSRSNRLQRFSVQSPILDSLLRVPLYYYQKQGVVFAAQAGRCLLADDMGLGKTIQAIATAQLLKTECSINRALIVCTTSLKYQWKFEIEKCTGESVLVVEGNATKRISQMAETEAFYVIVSYSTLLTDLTHVINLDADIIILDEAQRIKNFKSKISKQVKQLQSPYAIVLSGTPIENKLEDLYSIMQFVDSYRLGPFYTFITSHQIKDEKGKTIGFKGLNDIGTSLSDVLLRRTRSQVLTQLPERTVKNLLLPMTSKQMYIHDEGKCEVAKLITKWKRSGILSEIDRHRLISQLNTMRMVCNSTYLLDQKTRHDTKVEEAMNMIEEIIVQGSEKVVVFSQWERMTRLIAQELDNRKIKYQYLHGAVPSKDRGKLLKTFTDDSTCSVFLSTDTGSIGLNLQVASLLINLDIPWSPAVLEQRISRIHRQGQKNHITVVNFIATGTIEQQMLDVLALKDSIAKGVLDNGDDIVFMAESRFKTFIGEIEKIIAIPISLSNDEIDEKELPIHSVEKSTEQVQYNLFDDDELFIEQVDTSVIHQEEIAEFVRSGVNFFDSFAELIANDSKREAFLKQYSESDEETGQTFLKIPIGKEFADKKGLPLFVSFLTNITNT